MIKIYNKEQKMFYAKNSASQNRYRNTTHILPLFNVVKYSKHSRNPLHLAKNRKI